MDQQFLPSSISFIASAESQSQQQKNMRHLEAIPRPFIHRSMEHTFFTNIYNENMKDKAKIDAIREARLRQKNSEEYHTVFIKYGDAIPQTPPFEEIAMNKFRGLNKDRVNKLKELFKAIFELRPMWSRRAMENMETFKEAKHLFNKLLVCYAYSFTTGPWKVDHV